MVLLVTSYYLDGDPERQAEIDSCFIKNCEVFDKIIFIIDKSVEVSDIPQTTIHGANRMFVFTKDRPTFKDAFNKASTHNPNGINIVANSDIYFKREDLDKIKKINYSEACLALSRVDETEDGSLVHWHKRDSQDAFVFQGEMFLGDEANFNFGIPGCDNRLSKIMSEHKPVYNPCNDISIYHLHNTGIRNYTKTDKVKGEYKLVDPCSLNLKPNKNQFYNFSHKSVNVPRRAENKKLLLTIMIPTMKSRRASFAKLITELFQQIDNGYSNNVEVLKRCDDGKENIGTKRNNLLSQAKGEYVVSVDDDDDISERYIDNIIRRIKFNKDCITFKGNVNVNGKNHRDYNFSINNKEYAYTDHYLRPPGHLTPIKREIAQQFKYKEVDRGSDVDWSMQIVMSGLIKTSIHIDEYMYFYNRIIDK